jgi:outer membrane receptor protein involved in Fe transport
MRLQVTFQKSMCGIVICIAFALTGTALNAQDCDKHYQVTYSEETPLLAMLNDLVARNIYLNFNHELVNNLKVSGECDSCTVEEILHEFLSGTGLTWMKIGNCHFTIYELAKGTIKGKVIDATTQESLPGANVQIRDTKRGGVTNPDGEFTIKEVPQGQYILDASYMGYRSKSIYVRVRAGEVVTDSTELIPSVIELGAIEIVADQSRISTAPNSVVTLDARVIQGRSMATFADVIQGLVPGIAVIPSGGLVGQGAHLRMRGSGLLTQIKHPLVFVDGFLVSNIEDINPDIIERVEVLRGISAVTLYGSTASSGVIHITSQKRESSRPRFSFKIEQSLFKYPDVYEPNVGFVSDAEQASRLSELFGLEIKPNEFVSRAFAKSLLGTGYGQTYSLSVLGGGSRFSYSLFGRVHRIDGPYDAQPRDFARGPNWDVPDLELKNDLIGRQELTVNLNVSPIDELTLFINSAVREFYQELPINSFNSGHPMYAALFGKPELATRQDPFGSGLVNDTTTVLNLLRPGSSRQGTSKFFNGTVRVDLSNEISLEGQVGIESPGLEISELAFDQESKPQTIEESFFTHTLDFRTMLTWKHNFGQNIFSITSSGLQKTKTPFGLFHYYFPDRKEKSLAWFIRNQLCITNSLSVTSGLRFESRSTGDRINTEDLFGRINREFDSTTSRLYPQLGVAFVPTNAFIMNNALLSYLRFRAAWGKAGVPSPDTLFLDIIVRPLPGEPVDDRTNNPAVVAPEKTTEMEVGFDASLLKDKANFELNYWHRKVGDPVMLAEATEGRAPSGFNSGPLKSSGIEIGCNFSVTESEPFAFEIYANASYLNEEFWPVQTLLSPSVGEGFVVVTRINGDNPKPTPDWWGALGARALFLKRFRLSTLFEFNAGNYFVNNYIGAQRRTLKNTPEPAETLLDGFWEKADFLRWREISLAYDLPKRITTRLGLDHATIAITGRNLFLWTGYSGINPEANRMNSAGIDYVAFPLPRQFSFSIAAEF